MRLATAEIGKKCMIKSLCCPCDMRVRMMNMGFVPGCPVELMSRINGTLLVKVGSTRMMLDCCLADQIQIG